MKSVILEYHDYNGHMGKDKTYINIIGLVDFDIVSKQKYYLVGDKLLPVIKHGILRSEENVNFNDFSTLDGV